MRYTPYSRKIKALLDTGAIGRLVSVQHLEPIGFWHFAHSYVRGNWRNEALSSSMLLAKACHDVDWLRWIVGEPCSQVSSFGSLQHFRADQKPAGAAARCLDCSVETSCPYSAKKIYLDPLERGHKTFPVDRIVDAEPTIENIQEALRTGPYGRCVFGGCDNDVVDQQVANFEFASGVTASLSVIAFTEEICVRKTRIFGTLGQIEGDGASVKVFSFLSGKTETFHPDRDALPNTQMTGHGCGDYWLMKSFVESVAAGDPSKVASGPRESLESHLMVFAAEEARKQRRVVSMQPQTGPAPKAVAPSAL
jgi:predicted dehydrogenase